MSLSLSKYIVGTVSECVIVMYIHFAATIIKNTTELPLILTHLHNMYAIQLQGM